MANNPTGVHLCGSVPFESSEEVFEQIGKKLGSWIYSVGDGETDGLRKWWIFCQTPHFQGDNIELMHPTHIPQEAKDTNPKLNADYEQKEKEFHEYESMLEGLSPGYDTWAIESYQKFKAAKSAGHIPNHVKFQVSLPTPLGVVTAWVRRVHRAAIEKIYTRKMKECVDRIQATIPHEELAIQWDYAMEPAILDGHNDYAHLKNFFEHHFNDTDNIKNELIKRLDEVRQWVAPDVDLGFHLCYGDLMHIHFKEPEDTTLLSEIIEMLYTNPGRHIDWIHIPVPQNRSGADYLEPLTKKALKLMSDHQTRLCLGLVHANDEAGTQTRIDITKKVFSEAPGLRWSIATECGWGRTPRPEIDSIIGISTKLAAPVVVIDSRVTSKEGCSPAGRSEGSA